MIVKNHDLKWVPHVQPTWATCSKSLRIKESVLVHFPIFSAFDE
jgi:hypothetical protein